MRNLATSFFRHEKFETTVEKAKELRPIVEKLITIHSPLDGRHIATFWTRQLFTSFSLTSRLDVLPATVGILV